MTETIPSCVPPGWEHSVNVRNLNGPSYQLLFYPWFIEGTVHGVRFQHRCDRRERGVIICAPLLHDDHGLVWFPTKPTNSSRPSPRPSTAPIAAYTDSSTTAIGTPHD